MKKSFTKEYILANAGCYQDTDQLATLLQPTSDNITIEDILNSVIPCEDKAWFICRKCELTEQQLQSFAIGCAELALPVYEAKYPNDSRVRDCIEATKQFIDGKLTKEELLEKRDAAKVANTAYYVAYWAAYVAFTVAEATNASRAAYWASDAIGDEKLLQYLIKFVNNN